MLVSFVRQRVLSPPLKHGPIFLIIYNDSPEENTEQVWGKASYVPGDVGACGQPVVED